MFEHTEPITDETEAASPSSTDHVVEADNMVDAPEENTPDAAKVSDEPEGEPEAEGPQTFPREYVEQLRQENANYRTRAKAADDLAQRLHVALVAATGRLADPDDLPFDAANLDDADALDAAITELVERKPHLRSRRTVGDVGQGNRGGSGEPVDLAGMLRSRT